MGLLIDKVCEIEDLLDSTGGSGTGYSEPVLTLPTCLQYSNAQGQTITNLQHSTYSMTLAQKICQINTTVNTHTSQIANHETRIALIESADDIAETTVTPNCILPALPTALNVVLDELENQFCQLKGTLGTNAAITTALAQQCTSLAASDALSQPGVMGTIPGWKTTVTTFADSFQNLWLTVCDMRAAISDLRVNGGSNASCSDFILNFTASASNDRSTVTLFFAGNTVIPSGYADCNQQGSKVTITDSSGNKYTGYVVLTSAVGNSGGVTFNLTGSPVSTSLNYTVTVDGCISKSGAICNKTATKTLLVPCSIVTNVTATLV